MITGEKDAAGTMDVGTCIETLRVFLNSYNEKSKSNPYEINHSVIMGKNFVNACSTAVNTLVDYMFDVQPTEIYKYQNVEIETLKAEIERYKLLHSKDRESIEGLNKKIKHLNYINETLKSKTDSNTSKYIESLETELEAVKNELGYVKKKLINAEAKYQHKLVEEQDALKAVKNGLKKLESTNSSLEKKVEKLENEKYSLIMELDKYKSDEINYDPQIASINNGHKKHPLSILHLSGWEELLLLRAGYTFVEDIIDLTYDDFIKIKGIKYVRAHSILSRIKEYKNKKVR